MRKKLLQWITLEPASVHDENNPTPFQQPPNPNPLIQRRRTLRRAKATLSIGIALAAGTFLSCQRWLGEEEQPDIPLQDETNTTTPLRPTLPNTTPQTSTPPQTSQTHTTSTPNDAELHEDTSEDTSQDTSEDTSQDALEDTPTDALIPTSPKPKTKTLQKKRWKRKRRKTDIREHRKGMPVIDNLLE